MASARDAVCYTRSLPLTMGPLPSCMLASISRSTRMGFNGVSLCTSILSSVRQGIEQELIQLRATGAVIPLQMCEGACKHQGRLSLQSYHMSYPHLGFVAEALVEWCSALANGPLRDRVLRHFGFEALVCMKTWRVIRVDPPAAAASPAPGSSARRSIRQILEDECGVPRGAPSGQPGTHCGLWNVSGGWRVPAKLLL